MRLLSITVGGAVLIAAGLAAPASGHEDATGDGMTVSPRVANPGDRVRLDAPGCERAESTAFAEPARLSGVSGTARLKPTLGAGTYPVVADCEGRRASAYLTVSTKRSWPSLLPSALNPQMARATQDDH